MLIFCQPMRSHIYSIAYIQQSNSDRDIPHQKSIFNVNQLNNRVIDRVRSAGFFRCINL